MSSVLSQRYEALPVAALEPHPENPRRGDVPAIAESLRVNGFFGAVLVQAPRDGRTLHRIIAGEHRWRAAQAEGVTEVPVIVVDVDDDAARRIMLADNRTTDLAGYDRAALDSVLASLPSGDMTGTGYDPDTLADVMASLRPGPSDVPPGPPLAPRDPTAPLLHERFVVPPFSLLDARQGYWQDRKRQWHALGIESETGRDGGLAYHVPDRWMGRAAASTKLNTSIFDPVLCEVAYRWFSPPGGTVLDPFAGGSVRGVVASVLGRSYTGVELRPEQIEANVAQAERMSLDPPPRWVEGDASDLPDVGDGYDLLFSCPPYHDLEQYSDDPRDLSNMPWDDFLDAYRTSIRLAGERVADDRFAVWVIGEVRAPDGTYRGLVPATVAAFVDTGWTFHNSAILATAATTAPIRATLFPPNRRLIGVHQHVLTFTKGDTRAAADACGDLGDLDLDLGADE